jgi:signal peptidase I
MNMFSKQNFTENDDTRLPVEPEPTTTELPEPKQENTFIEILRFSVMALLIVIPVRMFIAQPFIVSGASMAETFHTGEYLIVDQLSYHLGDPSRGDVIVFRYPLDPSKYFIKRVIGLPGDTIVIEDSQVTVINDKHPEGIVLEEPYVTSMRPSPRLEEELGDREYFVMGDNRDESSDSRIWGVLQKERIVGRALVRLFPPSTASIMPGALPTEVKQEIN